MKLFKKIPYIFILLLWSCQQEQPSTAQEESTEFSIDSALQKVVDEQELIGMSVIVFDSNHLSYEGYFGVANHEKNISTNAKTSYRIASISKSVTAAATMLLVEKELIDLDKDVNTYLGFSVRNPYFPDTPITLRMLLNHTSSIVDNGSYGKFSGKMFSEKLHIKELLEPSGSFYNTDIFLEKKPGTYFTYSNVTWGIVGTVVERVSGKSFQTFCKENLFEPLEMEASFDPAKLSNIKDLAILYRHDSLWVPQKDSYDSLLPTPVENDYEIGTNALVYAPQGGLRVSAKALSNFMVMLMNLGDFKNKKVMKKETIGLMLSSQWKYGVDNGNTSHDLFHSWGLGIHILTNKANADIAVNNLKMCGHPGEAYGLISDMYFNPAEKKGFIFITNGKKRPFKTVKESAFYETEAKVFNAIQQFYENR